MPWLTSQQAAELTSFRPDTIRQLAAKGKIKAQRWGRDWQIDKASLLAYYKASQKIGKTGRPRKE